MAGFAPRHHHYLLLTVPLCALLLTVSVHPLCVQLEELYPGIRHKLAVALQVLGGGGGEGWGGLVAEVWKGKHGCVSVGRQGRSGANTIWHSHCVAGVKIYQTKHNLPPCGHGTVQPLLPLQAWHPSTSPAPPSGMAPL